MKLLFMDYETFYTDEYSLKKMTPVEYILDPRFIVNGCAFKEGLEGTPYWVDGPDFEGHMQTFDPNDTMTISHNALFDASILAWRYGFIPKLTCCTLSVARATIRYALKSLSLDSVARFLGLGTKDFGALISAKGMDLNAIRAAGLYQRYVDYGIEDVAKCAGVFKKLVVSGEFPLCEIPILDMTLRMTLQPSFRLDPPTLALHRFNVLRAKSEALSTIGSDIKSVRQDETFANMLRAQGVEPPTKLSPTTGLTRYAFAKTDEEFLELQEHENPMVQALVAARLGAKSTIEETRTQRFINISELDWPITFIGNMPMPVRFSGAHTHRGSGDWSLNVQNLTRGGELRKSLKAPPGYKVVTVDSSQIEARLTAFLARQMDLLQQFENGDDVYSNFASDIYHKPITKADKKERYVGKQAILGLGFGLGWPKFQKRLKTDSKNQTGEMIVLSDEEAQRIVYTYRGKYSNIPLAWRILISAIDTLANGGTPIKFGPVIIEKGLIHMPGRLKMYYHGMSFDKEPGLGWAFTFEGKTKRIYGGKMLENIVQYLDRILVFDAAARIQHRITPYILAQQAHDENCYVVEEQHVDAIKVILKEEMTRRPDWGPDLPLMCEVGVGDSYGDAK